MMPDGSGAEPEPITGRDGGPWRTAAGMTGGATGASAVAGGPGRSLLVRGALGGHRRGMTHGTGASATMGVPDARLHGAMPAQEGIIESYLAENRAHKMYSVRDPAKGKLARTATGAAPALARRPRFTGLLRHRQAAELLQEPVVLEQEVYSTHDTL